MNKHVASLMRAVGCLIVCLCIGCGDETTGTSTIKGTVESFDGSSVAVAARLGAAVQGVIVYIDGPVSRSTHTAANGSFEFAAIPAGSYGIALEYGGRRVVYRNENGDAGTVSVEEDWELILEDVRVNDDDVSIGLIATADSALYDSPGDDLYDSPGDDLYDSSGDDRLHDSAGDDQADVSGSWRITLSDGHAGDSILVQSGVSISGSFGSDAPVSGAISGSSLSIKITDSAGCDTRLTGDIEASGNSMSGDWESQSVGGNASCIDASGTWQATRL